MNRTKLEIVNLNNEDLIATSCDIAKEYDSPIAKKIFLSADGVVWGGAYVSTNEELNNDIIIKANNSIITSPQPSDFVNNSYYHFVSGENGANVWFECTNIEEHKEPEDIN